MSRRRICIGDGPCRDTHLECGGLMEGPPPRALWAVKDEDGSVGCIAGEPGRTPDLLPGEVILGCYQYDAEEDCYAWYPSKLANWPPGPYPEGHRLAG